MLQLKEITKNYTTGELTQTALDRISISFRKTEFVAVLGESGSGKTTLLNIIGGLDSYDSGEMMISGVSTADFDEIDWDAYRNNSIGFIFQNYNLIPHLNLVDNVIIGMSLSGMPSDVKHKKALQLLAKVGLEEHVHKTPNQLSGGQMQRVAIARALANDPNIILADEPTGALDTETSRQILDLIKEIAQDKLVIMVTHNQALAEVYADRIIRLSDGKVVDDSNPADSTDQGEFELNKTSMSFFAALRLSGKNIATKKWRTTLTALASSLGIIGIALILGLSSGFRVHIDQFQEDALTEFPIIIAQTASVLEHEPNSFQNQEQDHDDPERIYPFDTGKRRISHTNTFTPEYLEYIAKIDPDICSSIGYVRMVNLNLLRRRDDKTFPVTVSAGINLGGMGSMGTAGSMSSGITSMRGAGLASYPETLDQSAPSYLERNYDLLAGSYPNSETDLVLVIDRRNRVDHTVLTNLGFSTDELADLRFDDIVGTELKLIHNDDYYIRTDMGNFIPNNNYDAMYDSPRSITLTITGVVKAKPHLEIEILGTGIVYSDRLVQRITAAASESEIVKAQKECDVNILNLSNLNAAMKQALITSFGGDDLPQMIFLFPTNFSAKDAVTSYLDAYNVNKSSSDRILYTDLASTITEMTGGIMNAITLVLIGFSAISLVVSLIMIGIITYISVLERTKEIGILRALGARKKDITRVFNAETFIIGALAGFLGITIAYLLTIPINNYIYNLTNLRSVAQLRILHAVLLVMLSISLTQIGGAIPAVMAAKKDPVEALRTE